MPGKESSRSSVVLLGAAVEGGLGLLGWALGLLLGCPVGQSWSWSAWDLLLGVAASLPMLAVFLVCVRWPWGPLARIKSFAEEVIRPLFADCRPADLLLISVLAGVGEELLFRGALQGAISRWLGPWAGLALASLLFGLAHPITPGYVVLAGLLGAYLGWLWMATGNLLTAVAAHAFYDFAALLFLVRGPAGSAPPPPRSDADKDPLAVEPEARQPEDEQDRQ